MYYGAAAMALAGALAAAWSFRRQRGA
jgi:hypothetical protein